MHNSVREEGAGIMPVEFFFPKNFQLEMTYISKGASSQSLYISVKRLSFFASIIF